MWYVNLNIALFEPKFVWEFSVISYPLTGAFLTGAMVLIMPRKKVPIMADSTNADRITTLVFFAVCWRWVNVHLVIKCYGGLAPFIKG